MKITLSLSLACASSLCAQSFSSPVGLLNSEAPSDHGYILGSVDNLVWQQVDATQRGTPRANIRSISWRRDAGLPTRSEYGQRTFRQLTIVMAHASIERLSENLGSNYTDTPVVVFGPRDVVTPDWSGQPGSAPAAFDLALNLDVPWSYNGSDDFLWEVRFQSVTPTPVGLRNFPYDFQPDTGQLSTDVVGGTFVSQGCIANGQTTNRFVLGVEVANTGGLFRIDHSVNFASSNSVVLTFLGLSDPNMSHPSLCANLRADPLVTLALAIASGNGSVPASRLTVSAAPSLIGRALFLQAAAFDPANPGIPVALTQGVQIAIPQHQNQVSVAHAYRYPGLGGAGFATVATGGVVTRFGF